MNKEQYEEMCLYLQYNKLLYYKLDDPGIPDAEYDRLEKEIEKYEKETRILYKYSPSSHAGIHKDLEKVLYEYGQLLQDRIIKNKTTKKFMFYILSYKSFWFNWGRLEGRAER